MTTFVIVGWSDGTRGRCIGYFLGGECHQCKSINFGVAFPCIVWTGSIMTPGNPTSFLVRIVCCIFMYIYIFTLEVNHHLKNGGSFWMMINPYLKNVVRKPFGNQPVKNGGWTSRVYNYCKRQNCSPWNETTTSTPCVTVGLDHVWSWRPASCYMCSDQFTLVIWCI